MGRVAGGSLSLSLVLMMVAGCEAPPGFESEGEAGLSEAARPLVAEPYAYPTVTEEDAAAGAVRTARDITLRQFVTRNARRPEAETFVHWDEVGRLRALYGDGLAIPMSGLGCASDDPFEAATCVVATLPGAFGDGVDPEHLRLVRTQTYPNGHTSIHLLQHVSGIPVRGGGIVLTFTPDGDFAAVFSRAASDMEVRLSGRASLESLFADLDRDTVLGDARALGTTGATTEERALIFVGKGAERRVGIPALEVVVDRGGSDDQRAIVDAVTGTVLASELAAPRYDADLELRTVAKYPAHSAHACNAGSCASYPNTPDCVGDLTPDWCVLECGTPNNCGTFATECCADTGAYAGYCCAPHTSANGFNNGVAAYDDGDWTSVNYERNDHFATTKAVVDQIIGFHYDILGRDGWDGANGPYRTLMLNPSSAITEAKTTYVRLGFGGWGTLASLQSSLDIHDTIGEEWGHNLSKAESQDGDFPDRENCLQENVAAMHATLVTVQAHGSDAIGTDPCTGGTAWKDDRTGIGSERKRANGKTCPGGHFPYAKRSRFDWEPCAEGDAQYGASCSSWTSCPHYWTCSAGTCTDSPTAYRNGGIWHRFMRVLSEGSSVFLDEDGYGEDVGVPDLTGIGWQTTARVVDYAMNNLSSSSEVSDFVWALHAGGCEYGVGGETARALGIAGFIPAVFDIDHETESTDRAPSRWTFDAWTASSNKDFAAWKVRSSYNMKVRRPVGSQYTTETVAANTDTAPTVAEYRDRVYFLWRDRTSSAIKYFYYNANNGKSQTFDLGTKSILTEGAFDATIFQDRLYLVYVPPSGGYLRLAWCSVVGAQGCTAAAWHDFGGGVFSRSLGRYAWPGLGVAAGEGMNGDADPTAERLYIVHATRPGYGTTFQMQLLQVDTAETVIRAEVVPTYYPSYQTSSEIGVRLAQGAFPRPAGEETRRYLYFAWKGLDGIVYKSVVQTIDYPYGTDDTWITRSDDTFYHAETGVRIDGGGGEASDETVYVFGEPGGVMWYGRMRGRY